MAKSADNGPAINSWLRGRPPAPDRHAETPPAPPSDRPPAKASEPLPAWLDTDTVRHMARLWQAVRRLDAERRANDPTVIGQEFFARSVAVAELAQRIKRAGWDAGVNPPASAPKLGTFTELSFAAWWRALVRFAHTGGDALLLAWCIWTRLPCSDQGSGVVAFLDELTAVDPEADADACLADLRSVHALRAQPAPEPRRGPKGPHRSAAARHEAAARELFAKRQAEGLLVIPNVDPWHLLGQFGAFIDGIIATDHGVSNSDHLQELVQELGISKSSLKQAWLGSASRHPALPSLRRRLVVEALADHCLNWWLNEAAREAGPFAN